MSSSQLFPKNLKSSAVSSNIFIFFISIFCLIWFMLTSEKYMNWFNLNLAKHWDIAFSLLKWFVELCSRNKERKLKKFPFFQGHCKRKKYPNSPSNLFPSFSFMTENTEIKISKFLTFWNLNWRRCIYDIFQYLSK